VATGSRTTAAAGGAPKPVQINLRDEGFDGRYWLKYDTAVTMLELSALQEAGRTYLGIVADERH
jgi:hypothetical protein